tara:strand:+ start:2475 stop:3404 length:930 start_codon:yes stop_codon:yes gene_type:complete
MSYEQLKNYISLIPYEKKEELKRNFYKEKIEEAIIKKTNGNIFIWKDLPEEVVELIMKYKLCIDIVWVPHLLKHNDFTITSMKSWLFNEYDFRICPTLDRENWANLWTLIINEKEFEEEYFDGHSIHGDFKNYYKIKMCDKGGTLSLTDYLEYRQEEKKEQKLKIQKKKQENIDSLNKFNVGDIITSKHYNEGKRTRYDVGTTHTFNPYQFLRIASETKTQYRLEIYTKYVDSVTRSKYGITHNRSRDVFDPDIKRLNLDETGEWIKFKNYRKNKVSTDWYAVEPHLIKYKPMKEISDEKYIKDEHLSY